MSEHRYRQNRWQGREEPLYSVGCQNGEWTNAGVWDGRDWNSESPFISERGVETCGCRMRNDLEERPRALYKEYIARSRAYHRFRSDRHYYGVNWF